MIHRLGDALRGRRNEVVALLVLFGVILLLPVVGDHPVSSGIYGRGLVAAAALALQGVGIVLVFRSNRFLNLAQLQLGALGGTVFAVVVQGRLFFRMADAVCPPCAGEPAPWLETLNYVGGAALGLGVAVAVGGLVHQVVIRPLASASQVVLTVGSLFVLETLAGLRNPLVDATTTLRQRAVGIPDGALPPPGNLRLQMGGMELSGPDLVMLVGAVVAIAAVIAYLRFTPMGMAVRAAASRRDRAETLGIPVARVTLRVWLAAGALSGVAAIATVMASGDATGVGGLQVGGLVRVLAVVTVARLESVWLVGAGALVFGLLDQVVLTVLGSTQLVDGGLLVVVTGLLLADRRRPDRADTEGAAWRTTREHRPIPAVLRNLPEVRRWTRLGTLALVAVLALLPWVMSPSQTTRIQTAMVYALVGLSLLVLTGWAGLVSLGQFAFAGFAGWLIAVLGLPLPLALVVGPAAGAAAAALVGLPAIRLDGLYLAVSTLALGLTTTAILLNPRYLGSLVPEDFDRPVLLGFDLDDQRVAYYLVVVVLTMSVLAVRALRRSRLGRALIAGRDNDAALASIGVGIVATRLTAFAVSGALAGLAGVLFTYQQASVGTDSFTAGVSVTLFVTTVIGGFGGVIGPLLGFTWFAIVSLLSSSPSVVRLTSGLVGIVLLLVAPGGLGQVAINARDSLLGRVAKRRRLHVPGIGGEAAHVAGQRAPLRPRPRPAGGTDLAARRYGLADQWLVDAAQDDVAVVAAAGVLTGIDAGGADG